MHFTVISGEMSEVIPILDYGQGPTEYFKLGVTVDADNKTDAKIIALKTKEMSKWVSDQRSDDLNPFAGLTVYEHICPHGLCQCDVCCPEGEPTCPPCSTQFYAEIAEQLAKENK